MKPRYKIGDQVRFVSSSLWTIYEVLGVADTVIDSKICSITYLLECGDTVYDDDMEQAWKERKFDIAFEKLVHGKFYSWYAQKDLYLWKEGKPIDDIIRNIRKEIGNV